MMTVFLTLEFTRAFVAELMVEAALGRAVEVVLFALAGLFWRALVGAVVGFLRATARGAGRAMVWVAVAWKIRWAVLRGRIGRVFPSGRKDERACSHRGWLSFPLQSAAC